MYDDGRCLHVLQELSKITMPVIFNEPLSFLQRMTEYMEYSSLLEKASTCADPVRRFEVDVITISSLPLR